MNPPTPSHQKDLFTFGGYRLDPARHTLEKDEKTLPLPPKAFELLMLLVQRRGELLTKADLLNALWPTTFVEENNLTQYISMLRKLLGEGQIRSSLMAKPRRLPFGILPGCALRCHDRRFERHLAV